LRLFILIHRSSFNHCCHSINLSLVPTWQIWNSHKIIHSMYLYLTSNSEIVTSFKEQSSKLISWTSYYLQKNAGCFGAGRTMLSFVSMETTLDIVGRSVAWSCTHKRPTWMHLVTSSRKLDLSNLGSTSSRLLPSFHNCHACSKRLLEQYKVTCICYLSCCLILARRTLTNHERMNVYTYISYEIEWPLCMVATIILLAAHNFQYQDSKAKYIRFHWDNTTHGVFWRHITTIIKYNTLLISILRENNLIHKCKCYYTHVWLCLWHMTFTYYVPTILLVFASNSFTPKI